MDKKPVLLLLFLSVFFLQGCAEWFALPTEAVAPETGSPARTAKPTAITTPSHMATKSSTPSLSPIASPTLLKTYEPVKIESRDYMVRCEEYLTLRSAPSLTAQPLGRVKKGAKVKVNAYEGSFARITDAAGRSGYVLAGYLVPVKADKYLAGLKYVKPAQAYSYDQMTKDLQSLAARYPGRLRLASAGKTLQGRDIPVAILGDPDAKHRVFVQGGIHAREYMTSLLILAQLEYILKYEDAPFKSGTMGKALEGVCIHLLPMANPDGVAVCQAKAMPDSIKPIYQYDLKHGYAGTKPADYLLLWKANAAGVDINRNFPAGWVDIDSPDAPSSGRYKGAKPADQPETKALMEYTKRYQFDATISYHAWGSCVYWQYGSNEKVNSRSLDLALAVQAVTYYTPEGSEEQDAGGYKDWVQDALCIPSVTIEIGARECPLPLDEFYTIWERNRNVLAKAAEWVKTSQ